MKKYIVIITLMLSSLPLLAQENMITLSGGYVFANIEEVDQNATGFRINGLYEFNPAGGKFAHGISVGFIQISINSK